MNKKALIVLAFGTFGLGIAEFAMMAILPIVAENLGVSIAKGGNFVSSYSTGVGIGALLLIFARRFQLKYVLMFLMSVVAIGNIGAFAVPNYATMILARFICGLPHGAFFGTGAIVAERIAGAGKGNRGVAIFMTGMMLANLIGVPLATALGTLLSWRLIFLILGLWAILVVALIGIFVPILEKYPSENFWRQFLVLRDAPPWLICITTLLGNAAIFGWYGYINPLLTQVGGFSNESMTLLIMVAGLGMVLGNPVSGHLADKYTPAHVVTVVMGLICLLLLAIFFTAHIGWITVILMFLTMFGFSALLSPEQVLCLRCFRGYETLGMTMIQLAFSFGAALGVSISEMSLDLGFGFEYPALIGAAFAFVSFILLLIFLNKYFSTPVKTYVKTE